MTTNMRVGIIGGGFAGLAAAYELAKAGHSVAIFEGSEHLGGLAGGFEISGYPLEKAYHHIFKSDEHLIRLIKELGLYDQLMWSSSKTSILEEGEIYPFNSAVDLLRFSPLNILDRTRTGFTLLFLKLTKSWQVFTDIKAHHWLKKFMGARSYSHIWRPVLEGKFGSHAQDISMAWLWARIHYRTIQIGYLQGSFKLLADRLEHGIANREGKVFLESRVERIIPGKRVEVFLNDGTSQKFDRILATIPTAAFQKILPDSNLKKIEYLGAICLVFTSAQSLSKFYWHNINDRNSPFVVMIQHTNLVDPANFNHQHVYYLAAYVPHEHEYFRQPESQLVNSWFKYLKRIFPEFSPAEVTDTKLFRLPYAQHIPTTNYPINFPSLQTDCQNVYLSNFSQIFPEDRGVNYAIREGQKAANAIINS